MKFFSHSSECSPSFLVCRVAIWQKGKQACKRRLAIEEIPSYFQNPTTHAGDARQWASPGFGIKLAINDTTEGQEQLLPAALYRHLNRLLESGLIEGAGSQSGRGGDRKIFTITAAGRQALERELRILQALVDGRETHEAT